MAQGRKRQNTGEDSNLDFEVALSNSANKRLGQVSGHIPLKAAIETKPPVVFASRLALREGNHKKPIYQVHKWWARRLGSVFRSLLLAATTPARQASLLSNGFFYERHDLSNLRVLDPFVGGGTSLVEAAKCGASVIGVDIDPVACFVTAKELESCNEEALVRAFASIESEVKKELLRWYRTSLSDGRKGTVVYAFWVDQIECPTCHECFDGHPHYQLRRFPRHGKQTVFCSYCGEIATLPLSWKTFECRECRKKTNIGGGTVQKGKAICPECESQTPLHLLRAQGRALTQKLFGLEVLINGTAERVFKKVDEADIALFKRAENLWRRRSVLDRFVPPDAIPIRHRDDRRPVSFGYRRYRDMFNARQLLCLSTLAEAISRIKDSKTREFVALAFSDCLAGNNMFCFYAFDYGKLTPLFGLHAYAKVSRPVENNVWGASVGRGSFSKCFNKLLEGKRYANNPFEYAYPLKGKPKQKFTGESVRCTLYEGSLPTQPNGDAGGVLINRSSEKLTPIASKSIHLILSDPPYYNNLAYSELSDFYHVWLKRLRLKSYPGNGRKRTPLKESLYVPQRYGQNDLGHIRFAAGLTRSFAECCRVLKDEGLFVFTFHHNDPKAWAVLTESVLSSGFRITNVFPVRSEGRSQFHSSKGNLKWDEVLVCRKRLNIQPRPRVNYPDKQLRSIELKAEKCLNYWRCLLKRAKLEFSEADARSLRSGLIAMQLTNVAAAPSSLEVLFSKSYEEESG